MDDADHRPRSQPASRGRVPSGALAAALHAQVAEVMHILASARTDAERHPTLALARLVEKYGQQVNASMLVLGEILADFLDESDEPVDFETLRANFLEPILSLSRSLPVYSRAEAWQRNKDRTIELHELVLEGRLIGFDAETLLLDNFYQNTIYARSLRTRVAALAPLIRQEAAVRLERGEQELRVLVLGANSVLNLASLFRNDVEGVNLSVVIVDGDTQALRLARNHLEDVLGVRPAVFRVKPESLDRSRGRIGSRFDLVFTLMQYDLHTPQTALGFTRVLSEMLAPGGALLTGSFLPSVPRSYRAIAAVFAEINWQYWDETAWKQLLVQLPFDLTASRFEIIPPATITVLARRSG